MPEPLRVACIGAGFIAGRHLAALRALPDVEVVAVADPAPGRAEQVVEGTPARAYLDGTALLDHEPLDAVWLCVPPSAHGPLEQLCVERRLPFFVEKPLAHDLDGARAVADAVAQAGLLTAVGYHWRHLEVVHQAAQALAAAPLRLLTAQWHDRTPAVAWWSQRSASGGQIVEQTTHVLDLARLLGGEVRAVVAAEAPARDGGDVPAASAVTLEFASGAVGSVTSTCALGWRHDVGLHAFADGVAVELSERSLCEHQLRVVTTAGDEQVVRSEADPVAAEDREFLDAVRGRVPGVRVPYAEGLRTHALACAADRSARTGERVELTEVHGG